MLLTTLALALAGCGQSSAAGNTLRLGYFPNLTHAAALVGVERGTFQQSLGANVKVKSVIFNAGPAEITALFADQIDIGYIGQNPAITGYVQSHGQALRIIAGAASGGAFFVVRPGANIHTPADLSGKILADPQLGGTQDVALRHYLQQHDLQTADKGGTVQMVPTDNATILTEFKQGKIDGAWAPEPWATRLIDEAGGQVFVNERALWPDGKFVTTDVIVNTKFLNAHPDLVKKFLQAHVDTVKYILSNPDAAQTLVNHALKSLTVKPLTAEEMSQAWANFAVTYDPLASTLQESADREYALGFLGTNKPDLSSINSLGTLNEVLRDEGLATVSD
ncbi:MAG TPA: ABC transporter substrate-binding protein [Ktedonobacterales bacterium]|nr:ABC transporter substrate-binding protein [Ktedonobacterales bacterium]